jgi:hypothetical protein
MKHGVWILASILILVGMTAPLSAQALDVSDAAISRLLAEPFQYDYTTITSDSALIAFISTVDFQLAEIEYRQRAEYLGLGDSASMRQHFGRDLEERYRQIMQDGLIARTFDTWAGKSSNLISRAFITQFKFRRNEFVADPKSLRKARELANVIADRLHHFRFQAGDSTYTASEAARLVATGDDMKLAHMLYKMQNDSAAVAVKDAIDLYYIYSHMGEEKGAPSTFAYSLSKLSFRPPEWTKIAQDLVAVTEPEYNAALSTLQKQTGQTQLSMIDIERLLTEGASLPDTYFPAQKADAAVRSLLAGMGLDSLFDKIIIRTLDSGTFPAVAIRLDPPYSNILIANRNGGFVYYRRLAAEVGRLLPWVFADTSLPHVLREYPGGAEESLTLLMSSLALTKDFLSDHFAIPAAELDRFERYNRWLSIYRLRQILTFYLFDYYLSEGKEPNPEKTYWSLEKSLLGVNDSSFQWIETLITGDLDKYPQRLASAYLRIKLDEILFQKFGEKFIADKRAGRFLIDMFCRPGRSLTVEQFCALHSSDRLSVADAKRSLGLK